MMPARLVASSDIVGSVDGCGRRTAWAHRRHTGDRGRRRCGGRNARRRRDAHRPACGDDGIEHVLGLHRAARRRAARPGQHAERLRRFARHVRVRRRDHRRRRGDVVPRSVLPRRDARRRASAASTSTICSTRPRATCPKGADGVLFLPYLMGERSPIWDGKASGAFVGLDALSPARASLSRRARRRRVRAAAQHRSRRRRPHRRSTTALIVVGGAAHSDLWMQIIADVTNRPVLTIERERRGRDGRGAARRLRRGARQRRRRAPRLGDARAARDAEAARDGGYARLFESYKALYPALKATMHDLRRATRVREAEPRPPAA